MLFSSNPYQLLKLISYTTSLFN